MLEALGRKGLMQLCPTLQEMGYVVEWMEGGMAMMRKALEWPIMLIRASLKLFLTGTVSLSVQSSGSLS